MENTNVRLVLVYSNTTVQLSLNQPPKTCFSVSSVSTSGRRWCPLWQGQYIRSIGIRLCVFAYVYSPMCICIYWGLKLIISSFIFLANVLLLPIGIYLCVFAYWYLPMCIRLCVYAYAYSPMCIRLCVFAYVYSPRCIRLCVFAYVYSPIGIYLCVFIYICIYWGLKLIVSSFIFLANVLLFIGTIYAAILVMFYNIALPLFNTLDGY